MEINAKMTRIGNSYGFIVPKPLLDCKVLDKDKRYKLMIVSEDNDGSIVKPDFLFDISPNSKKSSLRELYFQSQKEVTLT